MFISAFPIFHKITFYKGNSEEVKNGNVYQTLFLTMSILNVTVSCFKNYRTPNNPKKVNLLAWLRSAKHREAVLHIRNIADRKEKNKLKAYLPCITPSGVFSSRSKQGLVKHTGIICLDIDKKENQHILNFETLIFELQKIRNITYCGLSVSGEGWFLLIPIESTKDHEKHFDALSLELWHRWSIKLDKACRDVSRLRGYSYDPNAYFNHKAVPHKLPKSVTTTANLSPKIKDGTTCSPGEKFYKLFQEIRNRKLDLTSTYHAWFEIGCSLANELGANGRSFFHELSQFNPGYSKKECDRQFDYCLRGHYNYSIGTFYLHCKNMGIV
jgi:VirE-like protein/primase-like protein